MTEEEDNRGSSGRRDYDDASANLNKHIQENDKRLRRFFVGALIAFAVIGLFTTMALVGFGVVLKEQQKTADQLATLVAQNQRFAKEIQEQRRDSIRTACEEQNARHDGTVDALMAGSDLDQKRARTRAAKIEIRRRRDVTITLIDAISPVQNCELKVKEAVQGG